MEHVAIAANGRRPMEPEDPLEPVSVAAKRGALIGAASMLTFVMIAAVELIPVAVVLQIDVLVFALVYGATSGAIFALALRRVLGRADVRTPTVALRGTRYELLVSDAHAHDARRLLAGWSPTADAVAVSATAKVPARRREDRRATA